jgi:hypothetical protein
MLEKAVAKLAAMQAPTAALVSGERVGIRLLDLRPTSPISWLTHAIWLHRSGQRVQPGQDFLLRGLQEGAARLPATRAPQPGRNAGAQIFRDYDNGRFDVLAHGAYVLAKSRKAPLATLRVLYDLRAQSQSGLALVHLGIALNLMGDSTRGNAPLRKA